MTPEDIARLFPYLDEADHDAAVAIFKASEPLQTEFAKFSRADVRKMLQQQVSQAVMSAVQMLGQK